MTQSKKLIIVRHAHRNKLKGGEADNGLSAKGKKQAKALQKFYSSVFGRKKAIIFSSPKVRCIETVQPIAKKIKVSLETIDSLDEAQVDSELKEKIRSFHSLWQKLDSPLTLICSHGDWIPAFLKQMLGVEIDLDKGGWIELELSEEKLKPRLTLRWIVQDPTLL
ncbi:MAG: phosphoglycerate mutase family protein [Bdellovibrionia bacterium]